MGRCKFETVGILDILHILGFVDLLSLLNATVVFSREASDSTVRNSYFILSWI
jgi:hypothetical protein